MKCVGYSKFTSKKGTPCCIINVVFPCSESDVSFGHVGSRVDQIFVPQSLHSKITPDIVNKEVTFDYVSVGGQPQISGIKF